MSTLVLRKEWFGGLIGDPHTYNLRVLNRFAFNRVATEIERYGKFSPKAVASLRAVGLDVDRYERTRIIQSQRSTADQRVLSAPIILWIELTSQCPLRCKHCFIRPQIEEKSRHISTRFVLSLIRQAYEMGVYKITLTGGEALLHPDVKVIIEEINKLGLGLRIFSSGSLNSSIYKSLGNCKIDTFFLSMDGMRKHHQYMRGDNTFTSLTDTIQILSDAKTISNLTLSITLDKKNTENLEDIFSFAARHEIRTLLVRPLMAYAWTPEISDISFTDKFELFNILEEMESIGQRFGIECQINKLPYFPTKKRTYYDDCQNNASIWNILGIEKSIDCVGGNLVCGVRWDGTISPCGFLPSQEVCISKEECEINLAEEWLNSPSLKKMRYIPPNSNCLECGQLPICNGGCRANSALVGTGIECVDPFCLLQDTPYGTASHLGHAMIKPARFPMDEKEFFVSPKNVVSKCGWATYET